MDDWHKKRLSNILHGHTDIYGDVHLAGIEEELLDFIEEHFITKKSGRRSVR